MDGTSDLLESLGIALGLGLMVGLQREWENNRTAGLRTFAFICLAGALSAVLARVFGGWVMAAALIAFALIAVSGYVASLRDPKTDPRLTTEIAMLVVLLQEETPFTGSVRANSGRSPDWCLSGWSFCHCCRTNPMARTAC